jgi:predicted nucleic acid-binding Zn ribbon protein
MKRPAPSAVGEILPRAFPQLAVPLLEQKIRRQWPTVVGSVVARRARPGSLSDGSLEIIVDNSVWLHELTLRSPELLARLSACFGPQIRAVRVTFGIERAPHPLSSRRGDIE